MIAAGLGLARRVGSRVVLAVFALNLTRAHVTSPCRRVSVSLGHATCLGVSGDEVRRVISSSSSESDICGCLPVYYNSDQHNNSHHLKPPLKHIYITTIMPDNNKGVTGAVTGVTGTVSY